MWYRYWGHLWVGDKPELLEEYIWHDIPLSENTLGYEWSEWAHATDMSPSPGAVEPVDDLDPPTHAKLIHERIKRIQEEMELLKHLGVVMPLGLTLYTPPKLVGHIGYSIHIPEVAHENLQEAAP